MSRPPVPPDDQPTGDIPAGSGSGDSDRTVSRLPEPERSPADPPRSSGDNDSAPLSMPTEPARVGGLGHPIAGSHERTVTTPRPGSTSAPLAGGRFAPGELLGGRYRIGGMIGRGGMGEVYRGEDLILGQHVALKFLPEKFASDPARAERFLAEVRLARQVSHPNVCRVYDIGEADGHTFLSMEYVEGDDLRTLLRRVGRLPQDRAVRIAHQLCAGLEAAHRAGILHRDLKPGNIIIDHQGNARILDFGLAAVAGSIGKGEVRAGTPAYMAPEQLAGHEVTERSDLFALGLVLYELFTGRSAFSAETVEELARAHASHRPAAPGDVVEGLSPRIDRVILSCLSPEARDRPASARAVAAALPGGDPLAAAIAAGETPSPQMVAAAGVEGRLTRWSATLGVGVVLALLVGVLALSARFGLISPVPLEKSAQELVYDARRILDTLGYHGRGVDEAYGFDLYEEYLSEIRRLDQSPDRWDRLARTRPSAVDFWYRRAPVALIPSGLGARVTIYEPAAALPGAVTMRLSPDGTMRELTVHTGWLDSPEAHAEPGGAPTPGAPNPNPSPSAIAALFSAAGLDVAGLSPDDPERLPPVFAESRRAWTGVYPESPDTPIRVESAWIGDRVVWFRIVEQRWARASAPGVDQPPGSAELEGKGAFANVLTGVVTGICLVLAAISARNRRGDREGAFRLAGLAFSVVLVAELLGMHHIVTTAGVISGVINAGTKAMVSGLFVWLMYMALEPLVRRQWPETLIAWSRLMSGQWRDPLVGQTALIGMIGGLVCAGLMIAEPWMQVWIGRPPGVPFEGSQMTIPALLGERHAMSGVLMDGVFRSIVFAVVLLATLVIIRLIVRQRAAALVVFGLLQTAVWVTGVAGASWLTVVVYAVITGVMIVAMVRFGLLAVVAGGFAFHLTTGLPVTTDLASWRFGLTAIAFILPAAAGVLAGLIAAQPAQDGRRVGLLASPSA